MKTLKYYNKTAQVLPISYTTQNRYMAINNHGLFVRAVSAVINLGVKK